MSPYSNLDLISQLDTFPHSTTHPELYTERISTLHSFVAGSYIIGYVTSAVVDALSNPVLSGGWWIITPTTIALAGSTVEERSAHIARTAEAWRDATTFKIMAGWRNELYSVFSPTGELYFRVERSVAALFGVVLYGVNMTAYVREPAGDGMRLWVPRRSKNKSTYPGMLDNTVAGGIASGMGVVETMLKECEEEASLVGKWLQTALRPVGNVCYVYERDSRAGGEIGLIQPEVQYVYDLELGQDVVPTPGDGEVEQFMFWDVEKVGKCSRHSSRIS